MALTPSDQKHIENIITFWFEKISPEQWFTKSAEFDQQLREAFEPLVIQALKWSA